MSLIEYTFEGKVNKVDKAIKRIKNYDPIQNGFMDKPFYVAYSGGKDSDVIRILCQLAGINHELWHNHTTVDAPETVNYIRSIPEINISRSKLTMWKLIVKKKIPPTRIQRYCCSELKESEGKDRFVMTGVRWEESNRRKNDRNSLEIQGSNRKRKIILNADNTENRRQFETCKKQGKRILNPIIDWTESEVWEFLDYYGCKSNPLYQCGFKRVGCVGCPMASNQKYELEERYPKYRDNYIRAFSKMLIARAEAGLDTFSWDTGYDVYRWWIEKSPKIKVLTGQMTLEELEFI